MSAGRDIRAAPRGFTLLEVVVVMALIAIMLRIAAPSFVTFQRNSQLTSTANAFIASMAAARAEAMKNNRNTYVVPDGRTGCTAGWTCGWYVFVDVKKDGTYNAADGDLLIAEQAAPPSAIATPSTNGATQFADGTALYVMFNGSGFPQTSANVMRTLQTLDFSFAGNAYGATMRRVQLFPAGRMRVCTPASSSDTTCSPS